MKLKYPCKYKPKYLPLVYYYHNNYYCEKHQSFEQGKKSCNFRRHLNIRPSLVPDPAVVVECLKLLLIDINNGGSEVQVGGPENTKVQFRLRKIWQNDTVAFSLLFGN